MRADRLSSPWFLAGLIVLTIGASLAIFLLTGWLFFFMFIPLPIFFWRRKK